MRRLVVSLGLTAVLGLTACGGGSSTKTAATTTPTTPPTTVPAPTTTIPHGNDQAGTAFCKLLTPYIQNSSNLIAAAGDPAKLKSLATDASTAITQAKDSAPAAIKADVNVVATTFSQVLAGLQKSNFVIGNTPEIAKLQDPAFQASFQKVSDYATAHCGVG